MSIGSFFLNIFRGKKEEVFDERFIMHRFKSTRFALLVGTFLILGLFTYEAVAKRTIRWDLFTILLVMAAAKLGAMLYYQRTN